MSWPSITLSLFILFSLAHLAAEAARSLKGRYITKPFLMPALGLYYAASAAQPHPILVAAIMCGWLGDICLMIPDPQKTRRFFRPGLAAFLLGHVLYIAVFAAYAPRFSSVPAWGWCAGVVYLAVGVAGYRLIAPHAGKMLPAINVYIMIIVLMGVSTIFPLGSVNLAGAITAMAGALVFMLSDTVNAYNKFVREIFCERVITMSTYLGGQFLLIQGYLFF